MNAQKNAALADYSTMGLGGKAKLLVTVQNKAELLEALEIAAHEQLPILVLGEGSNVIFRDGFAGMVILNRIGGFAVVSDDTDSTLLRIGAGEHWDSVVARTVELNLSGIEKLSAIPGTAGATPVQNVGAYGAEIADTLVELEAYDQTTKQFVTLDKAACRFSYRDSNFKSAHGRRYIITGITLRLNKTAPVPPFYDSLQKYLDEHRITVYTPRNIREAVTAIRAIKLPDPARLANTGSFFKNPIVDQATFDRLQAQFPTMPHWPTRDSHIKLAAGWLIEQAGLKGYRAHGMKIYEQNALVFVNESATSYDNLEAFRQEIVHRIEQQFSITLEQEPELL